MKTLIIIGSVVAVLLLGGVWWSQFLQNSNPSVLSRNGLHWHPILAIDVRGEKVEIPADIGLGAQYAGMPTFDAGMRMTAMHTHDDVPLVHLEFSGIVRKEDVTLGNFFRIWGKDFHSFGENVHMTVNGEVSTEYENYVMRDGDRIELSYE